MKVRALSPPLLLALALCAGAPRAAESQTVVHLNSSLIPGCANLACSQVYFNLNLTSTPTASYIKTFTINTAGGWMFGVPALVKIFDQNGNDVTSAWTVGVYNGRLTVTAMNFNQPTSLQPLLITANFANGGATGPQAALTQFTYDGQGCYSGNCNIQNPPDVEFHGTASPEPITAVLLGTGLLGVGALRRRRRKTE